MAGSEARRRRVRSPRHPPQPQRRARGSAGALVDAARKARDHAVAPFSGFRVGAALETEDGTVVTGCNVENASYGLTMCAERVAMFKAVSDGHRAFRRIAIVADTPVPTAPCGPCRQILWEYGGDLEVILANLAKETGRHRMRELLPTPFDAGTLRSGGSRAGLKAGATGDAVNRRRR